MSIALSTGAAADQRRRLWDTWSDTWSGVDALGRKLPGFEEVGAPRRDRFVGMFYFLWHGTHAKGGPYDVSTILEKEPGAMTNPASPLWGPLGAPHHWGQSLFGYYETDDEYVLRKHAQMLSDAGIDVIFFDVTNRIQYTPQYMKLLEVFEKVRSEGGRTPQVAFLCPFSDPGWSVRQLYSDLYGKKLYDDLWFRWRGKPLILADPTQFEESKADKRVHLKHFFTFRAPQPDYFAGPTKPDMWSWLENFPQHVFRNSEGQKEQMSVGVAQNAVDGRLGSMSELNAHGRSWHNGSRDTSPNAIHYGFNFAEQFEHAIQEDPEFVFVTGWNEWWASRFNSFNGVNLPVMFVDEFDEEHSRDIEPMLGGHGDDYYYQLVSFVRKFKGVRRPPVASAEKMIDLDGSFDQWREVEPEFRDDIGDPAQRDHQGWHGFTQYVNHTGRNDFVVLKIAHDRHNLYFYARTKDPITAYTDPSWMTLFINTDSTAPSWEGYQFVLNRQGVDAMTTALEESTGGWNWREKARVRYRVAGSELQLAIKAEDLHLDDLSKPFEIQFKWMDNMQKQGDIDEFTIDGDAAPNGRFCYRYISRDR